MLSFLSVEPCVDTTTPIWCQVTALILSLLSIGISVYTFFYSRKLEKDKHKTLLFCDYTRRYQEIILAMPESLTDETARSTDRDVIRHMRLYFDLCSEEFYLHDKGYFPEDIWKFWVAGLRDNLKRRVYHNSWLLLEPYYNANFCDFMNNQILNSTTH